MVVKYKFHSRGGQKKKILESLLFDQVLWQSLKSSNRYRHWNCQGYGAGLNSGRGNLAGWWRRGQWIRVDNVYVTELRGGRRDICMSP